MGFFRKKNRFPEIAVSKPLKNIPSLVQEDRVLTSEGWRRREIINSLIEKEDK
jgi:hypothetical protein